MANFEVWTEQEWAGRLVLRMTGDLDLDAYDEVDTLLATAQGIGAHSVIVDLRGLRFIDSTGIRILLKAQKRAEKEGCNLRILRGSAAIQRIFALTDLNSRLPFVTVYPSS